MKHKALLATLFLTLATSASAARLYPTKPVTIVVPFAPGGGVDIITRAVGAKLAERWKQPVVIENKAGAGSAIGAAQVARSPADGYTLLATVNQSIVGNRFLYKKLGYDPDKDFDPLTLMVKADQLIVANGARNDIKNKAAAMGGNLVYLLTQRAGQTGSKDRLEQTNVTLSGNVYRCASPGAH